MNPWLLLGLGAAAAYVLLSSSSSSSGGTQPTAAQLAQGAYGPGNPILPPNPAAYSGNPYLNGATTSLAPTTSLATNGVTPGTVAAQTVSGPMFHTGATCMRTGAPVVQDSWGNAFLMGTF